MSNSSSPCSGSTISSKAPSSTSVDSIPQGGYRLDAHEILFGSPLGVDADAPEVEIGGEPWPVLEALLVEALQRPPCVVTFSGGRDSSVVLAAAAAAARQHGLDPPIPLSMRFPDAPDSVEDQWQERVVRFLDLDDWEVVTPGTSLDFLGPPAVAALEAHGLLWPANAHFVLPAVEMAAGGSVLTGAFGDEIFTEDARRTRARRARYDRRPRTVRDLALVMAVSGPVLLRRLDAARRAAVLPVPAWLRPAAAAEVRARLARQMAAPPLRWDRAAVVFPRLRYARAGLRALRELGAPTETTVTAPLGAAPFVAAVAATAGKLGFDDRTTAMHRLFGHLLPNDVLSRSTKASFGAPFWGPASRAFAQQWQGWAAAGDLVDTEQLRAVWLGATDRTGSPPPFAFQSATALQAAYLDARESRSSSASSPSSS